jgi:hypothetical protein
MVLVLSLMNVVTVVVTDQLQYTIVLETVRLARLLT